MKPYRGLADDPEADPVTDRSSWWDDLDAELAAGDAPDPWAHEVPDAPALTPDQTAFLIGLEDQPPVPRLTGVGEGFDADTDPREPGDALPSTGSPPGDTASDDS
jgi:hypothetical protein